LTLVYDSLSLIVKQITYTNHARK